MESCCGSREPGRGAVNEFNHAVALANTVLDCPHCDPDTDLAVLARQFLRAREKLADAEARIAELSGKCQICNGDAGFVSGFAEWDDCEACLGTGRRDTAIAQLGKRIAELERQLAEREGRRDG